jgi:predicted PurR-regulated permease PerM
VDLRFYLSLLLFAATVLVLWAFGLIVAPFAVPIAWAMCFVTVTGGLYRRLAKRTGKPRLSAFLMTVGVALAVLAPLVLVVTTLAREAAALSSTALAVVDPAREDAKDAPKGGDAPASSRASAAPATADGWDRFFERNPRLRGWRDGADRWLASFGTDSKAIRDQAAKTIGRPFAAGAFGVLQGLAWTVFGFVVMLATLYFLYRDGGKMRALVIDLSPLPVEQTTRVLDVLRSTAFAAVVGGLATALVQGMLGGLAFAITGVEAPVFWGFVMAVLSLLPVGGSAFVWAPVAGYFLFGDETWKGWFLLAWGLGVIGTSDNVLRPWLMRRAGAGEVHPLLLFFAVISGIGLFGFSGIVFGPLLVAFVLVVVQIFREQFGKRTAPPVPPMPGA